MLVENPHYYWRLYMRRKKMGVAVISVLFPCLLLLTAGCGEETSEHIVVDETLDTPVTAVDIQWVNGTVTLEQSDSGQIRMVQNASDKISRSRYMTYDVENGRLTITDNNKKMIGFTHGTDLILYLPEAEYESIRVDTVNGLVAGDRFEADQVEVDVTNGDISLNAACHTLLLDTVNGDVDVSCQTMPDMIDLDITNGDASLALPEECGFTLDYNKDNLESAFPLIQEDDSYVHKTGQSQIKADITNGKLELLMSEQ